MKFIFLLCFVMIVICVLNVIQAAPQKTLKKRALAIELCPENSTMEQCIAYAKEKSKQLNFCHTFDIGYDIIHWQGCGKVYCGKNTKVIKEDLNKSYPDCCEFCEIIDDNKEAFISGTL